MLNQNPEQIARDNIDRQLIACGWIIQSVKDVNLHRAYGKNIMINYFEKDVRRQIVMTGKCKSIRLSVGTGRDPSLRIDDGRYNERT